MPIDIASGTVKLDAQLASLPGYVPLVWDAHYSTAQLDKINGALGLGWTNQYYATLSYSNGQFTFITPEGAAETFYNAQDRFANGQPLVNWGAHLEVLREGPIAVVRAWDVETGEITRYVFANPIRGQTWRLTAIEDVTGQHALDLTWDHDKDQLIKVQQRLERRALHPRHDKLGRITQIDLEAPGQPALTLARCAYDDSGRLIEISNAADFSDRFEYDAESRIVREIAHDGGVFHYRYDPKGRCVLYSGLAHYNEKRLRFIDGIHITEVTNSCGESTTFEHLPSGQAIAITNALGQRSTTVYDEYGRTVVETDATGSTTRYTYDAKGNRDSITDALGQLTRFSYNEHHQAVTLVDAAGHKWLRAYDERQRLIATMDPLQGRWQFTYDAEGNVVEVINPMGCRKHQRFERGVLQSATDWMGHATHYAFDASGRVVQRTGALGERTCFSYDVMGNPTQVELPDSTKITATYDHAGNLTRFIDGNGHMTRWRYGPCSRLLERTDPVGNTVRYLWGSERGRLEAVINEKGEQYRFERDDAGRIVREISFDGAVRQFKLDGEGHSIAYTNANEETIAIQRDPLHRVLGQLLPDGEQISYAFDPLGNLISAVNADIAVTMQRDALGRITKEIQGQEWVASRYDAVGNVIHTKTSLAHEVRYEHDANGRMSALTTAGDKRIEFERDAHGQEIARKLPGGALLTQKFDVMGRMTAQHMAAPGQGSGAQTLVQRDYTYDRNGALTRIVDGRWGQVDYAYDPAERLLSAIWQKSSTSAIKLGGPSERFEYDATGNLTRMQAQGASAAWGAHSTDDDLEYGPGNRLLRKGTTRYEYDAEGRRVRKIEAANSKEPKVWTYDWNALDRMKAVTRPDGERWVYRYDGLVRRISKEQFVSSKEYKDAEIEKTSLVSTVPALIERFIWSQDFVIHWQRGDQTSVSWIFEEENFAPLAKVKDDNVQVLVNDHLGTPRELVDECGNALALSSDGAWKGGSNSDICPISFQGQWHDNESELQFNRNRYYDRETGKYVSEDPILVDGGINLSAYGINPIEWLDPLGLQCWDSARKNYWKTEAKLSPKKYSSKNLARMQDGKAPKLTATVIDRKGNVTQVTVSMELHHTNIPQRVGGAGVHDHSNLTALTPWQHETVDPFRHTGQTLVSVDKGVKKW